MLMSDNSLANDSGVLRDIIACFGGNFELLDFKSSETFASRASQIFWCEDICIYEMTGNKIQTMSAKLFVYYNHEFHGNDLTNKEDHVVKARDENCSQFVYLGNPGAHSGSLFMTG